MKKFEKWTLKKIKKYITCQPTCMGWLCDWLLGSNYDCSQYYYGYSKTKAIDIYAHYIKEHLAYNYFPKGRY